MDFTLHKMALIDGKPNSAGHRIIAVFNINISGFKVVGCFLVEKGDGTISANGPWGETSKGFPIKMVIYDRALRHAVIERARKLYEGQTGRMLGENMIELAD